MGRVRIPEPALVVVGVIHADANAVQQAIEKLREVLREVRVAGEEMPFCWTDYYEKEMGVDLKRCFLASRCLAERQLLADLKHFTMRVERELARRDGTRRINLDPGLLSPENFVLATTKNHAHRIYLRDGIFAEVTLRYVQGKLDPLDWTYPDYRSDEIRRFLEELRKEYLLLLRGSSPFVLQEVRV